MKEPSNEFSVRLAQIINRPLFEGGKITSPYIFFLIKDILDNAAQYKTEASKEVNELKRDIVICLQMLEKWDELKDKPWTKSEIVSDLEDDKIKLKQEQDFIHYVNALSPKIKDIKELLRMNMYRLN